MMDSFKYASPDFETPVRYKPFAPTNTFVDVSFSTYLNPVKNDQEARIDDSEISIFDAQKYFSEGNNGTTKQVKTFPLPNQKDSSEPSDLVSVPRLSSVSSVDGYARDFRTRSFHATPTASSEASWNSQTGLLTNPPGSFQVSLRNVPAHEHGKRRSSAAKRWILGRKCCCTGKKSVQVKEGNSSLDTTRNNSVNSNNQDSIYPTMQRGGIEEKPRQESPVMSETGEMHQRVALSPLRLSPDASFASTLAREKRVSVPGKPFHDGPGGFSFPILDNGSSQANKPALKGIMSKPISPLDDPHRDSLEIFQPISRNKADPQVQRILPSNPGPRIGNQTSFTIPGSAIPRMDDDAASDASSDLFEIDSFNSSQVTSHPMYLKRDSLDEPAPPAFNARRFLAANGLGTALYGERRRSLDEPPTPSIAGTDCYPPSEVSIDWSVTTAEGFDRASLTNFSLSASEFGIVPMRHVLGHGGEGGGNDSGARWKGTAGLLSCRHEKAVSVGPGPNPVRAPLSATTGHVQGRAVKANKPPLGSSHSARLSLAFAA